MKSRREFIGNVGKGILSTMIVSSVGNPPDSAQILEEKNGNVKFLGSPSDKNLALIYRKADLFVFPSRADSFGVLQNLPFRSLVTNSSMY